MKHIKIQHDEGVAFNWQLDPKLQSGAVVLYVAPDVAPSEELCQPAPCKGEPRTDYEREYWVVPQDAIVERYLEICRLAFDKKITVGFSYDDAGIGNLTVRKVVLWDIPEIKRASFRDWYINYYQGTWVTFA